ncbi:MAG: trigger factor [Oscillospiraceae bacterium]|nr:trigger factor [Oscillospiraceae bacterium]
MNKNLIRLGSVCTCLALALSLAGCGASSSSSQAASGSSSAVEDHSDVYSAYLNDDGTLKGVDSATLVTLPQYKGISVPAEEYTITDNELNTQINSILDQYATYDQITDRAIADGDVVNIDYVGTVDGEEFSGGNTNGRGTLVTAGSDAYIDDFLTQIIGHTPGETFDVNVTFPDPYENNPDLAGKAAVFHTTINYIQGDKQVPELTDEFVSQTSALADYGTAQGMKDTIRTSMEDNKADNYVLQKVLDACQFSEFPADLVDQLVDVSMAQFESQASAYGLDMETARSMMGYESEDAQREAMTASAQEQLKTVVMLEAIAKAEGLTVDEDALTNYFSTNVGTSDYSAYQTYYGRGYLCQAVLLDSAMDLVTSSAVRA